MATCADWTQLPSELVESISQKLTIYSDYLRFRCVCHSWQSSTPKTPTHLPPQLPWLIPTRPIPPRLLQPLHLAHFFHIPQASSLRKRRRGSYLGWLLILNPLTRVTSPLPRLSSFPNVVSFDYSNIGREYLLTSSLSGELYTRSLVEMRDSFIKKFVLTSSPNEEKGGFVAVVIVNQTGDLAYCKGGGDSLTRRGATPRMWCISTGCFARWIITAWLLSVMWEREAPVVRIIEAPRLEDADMRYLVKSGDDLLLVSRYLDVDHDIGNGEGNVNYRTLGFDVFRMNWTGTRWVGED